MELVVSAVASLLMFMVSVVVAESAKSSNALVEARYDHYEDIFRYWWPWFSDLSTVVAIKLKIWIVLVAMYVFGDGYYWSKWNGSNIFDKGQYVQHPPSFGWGRRRKRRAVRMSEDEKDTHMAELIFDQLDIEDDTCRKRIVCELYLEGKRVPEVWRVMHEVGYEVFRAYRPKSAVLSSTECGKLYHCELHQQGEGSVKMQTNVISVRWGRLLAIGLVVLLSIELCTAQRVRRRHPHYPKFEILWPLHWVSAAYVWGFLKLGAIFAGLMLLFVFRNLAWGNSQSYYVSHDTPV
uniref:Uncharacterized protein n=1 Tax=Anopheles culicifacies TaxID=139723 RepID=A0A182MDM9_9DIPT